MEIFFVRHGETSGNVARRHQAEKSPLTFAGEEQVKNVAKTLKEYGPTHIVTSSLVRAIDTAKVIGNECGLTPETSFDFAEVKRPDQLYGRKHFNLMSIKYYLKWFFGKESKSFTGGESYEEFLDRIKRSKEYLSKLPPNARVIVVSHSVFINFFLVHLCDEEKMPLSTAVLTFKKLLTMPNTQITHVLFDSENRTGTCSWILDM